MYQPGIRDACRVEKEDSDLAQPREMGEALICHVRAADRECLKVM